MSSSRYGSQTVYTSQNCQETKSTGSPDPTWDTIDAFLRSALHVASGGNGGGTGGGTPPPAASCQVTYTANTWNNGFTADVTVENTGTTAVNGWTLTWTCPGNQQVTNAWNATVTQSGTQVTARDYGYNGALGAGAGTDFGFQATYSGTNTTPTGFALNGSPCTTP